jgi:kynurenine formamidase
MKADRMKIFETPDIRGSFTIEDLHASAERNKQWGRWGEDDEIGTLNNVTPEMVEAAAKLVKGGRVFSLALDLNKDGPQRPRPTSRRFNPIHVMLRSGVDCCSPTFKGNGVFSSDDMVTMPLQCATHWDALSHIFYYDKMWNGHDARLVSNTGAAKCGIEKTQSRMVGRGVLLDIPGHLNLRWLPDGFGIGVDLMEECARRQGVAIGAGDFLLVRTGQMDRCLDEGAWGEFAGGDAPGLAFETADWLRRKDLAAVATDTWGVEVRPNEVSGVSQPLHWVALPMIGLSFGEMFRLGELAKDCAEDGTYEFFFCGAALPFTGAVGAPVNPIAVK